MILVVTEQRNGSLNPVSWETVSAAQQMGDVIKVVVVGSGGDKVAQELAGAAVSAVKAVEAAGGTITVVQEKTINNGAEEAKD